jgi:hypothetical protein
LGELKPRLEEPCFPTAQNSCSRLSPNDRPTPTWSLKFHHDPKRLVRVTSSWTWFGTTSARQRLTSASQNRCRRPLKNERCVADLPPKVRTCLAAPPCVALPSSSYTEASSTNRCSCAMADVAGQRRISVTAPTSTIVGGCVPQRGPYVARRPSRIVTAFTTNAQGS